jgi:DNA replication protein DnaT
MTPTEYIQLNSPRLSHPARTLYYLQLRRLAESGTRVILSYPELGRALAVEDPQKVGGFAYQVNASQLTQLLDELQTAGLIQLKHQPQQGHYHGAECVLPCLTQTFSNSPIPQAAHPMHPQWRPGDSFHDLAKLCGLLESQFHEEDLGEFMAYWLGRPEVYATDHQWMLKFIKALKARRYTKTSLTPMVGTGYQQVAATQDSSPSPRALQMIAEARRLRAHEQGDSDEKE